MRRQEIEVEEYKKEVEKKPDVVVNEPVEKPPSPISVTTEPVTPHKTNRKSAPPLEPQSISYDTYSNEPNRKNSQRGMSCRARMSALFGNEDY